MNLDFEDNFSRYLENENEIRAAASSLHSVYNGYETILKSLAKNNGWSISNRQKWHKELLDFSHDLYLSEAENSFR